MRPRGWWRGGGEDDGEVEFAWPPREIDGALCFDFVATLRGQGRRVLDLCAWSRDEPCFFRVQRSLDVTAGQRVDLGLLEPLPTRLEFVPRVVDELGVEHALLDVIDFEVTRLDLELTPMGESSVWLSFEPRRSCTAIGLAPGEFIAQLAMDRHWRTRPARGWRFDFEREPTHFHFDGDDVIQIEVPIAPTGFGRGRMTPEHSRRLTTYRTNPNVRRRDADLVAVGPSGRLAGFRVPQVGTSEDGTVAVHVSDLEFGANRIVGWYTLRNEDARSTHVLVDQMVEVRPREEFDVELVPREGATLVGRVRGSFFVEARPLRLPGEREGHWLGTDLTMHQVGKKDEDEPRMYRWSISGLLPDSEYRVTSGMRPGESIVVRTGAEGTTVDVGLVE